MSPLAMWATSWAITASISSLVMPCSRPVVTATSDEFLNAPVAKALGSPSKMPTSGMPIWAFSASLRTVSTIQASSAFCGPSGPLMTRTPALHLATGLLINSEIIAPPKPMISAKPSKADRFSPLDVRKRFTPNRLATMPSTATTAMLVSKKSSMRFIILRGALTTGGWQKKALAAQGRIVQFYAKNGAFSIQIKGFCMDSGATAAPGFPGFGLPARTKNRGVIIKGNVFIPRPPTRHAQHRQGRKRLAGQLGRTQVTGNPRIQFRY